MPRKSFFKTKLIQLRGEHLVAEKLCQLGWHPLLMTEGYPGVDIVALNEIGDDIRVQVKSRTTGTWHAKTTDGQLMTPEPTEDYFWVFVDFTVEPPRTFVCPNWWIRNNIYERYQSYLARHGGTRPRSPSSTHHKISLQRIEDWEDRWGLVDINNRKGADK